MKARTRLTNGEIFFAYEDYDGTRFGTWKDIALNGRGPCYLIGYFVSYYAGCVEPIDEMFLAGRPTVGMVRNFIENCKIIMDNEKE